jgi:hypothetical protein
MTGRHISGEQLAWASALEGAARSVYRYLGWPEDSGHGDVRQHREVSWEAATALSGGLLALAVQAEAYGLTWPQVAALAAAEQLEIQRHLDADR